MYLHQRLCVGVLYHQTQGWAHNRDNLKDWDKAHRCHDELQQGNKIKTNVL